MSASATKLDVNTVALQLMLVAVALVVLAIVADVRLDRLQSRIEQLETPTTTAAPSGSGETE